MTRRLPSEKKTAWQRNRLASVADRLTDDTLADLRRRAGHPQRRTEDGWQPAPNEDGAGLGHHDGYPPGGTTSGHGSDVADPTFARAHADAGGRKDEPDTWRTTPDPIGDAIVELFDKLRTAADIAASIDKLTDYILNAERAAHGRTLSLDGTCLICDSAVTGVGNDRLRAGYCCACYSAWRRSDHYDRGDHLRFRRQRSKELQRRDRDEPAA